MATKNISADEIPVEEIEIEFSWGKLAGKWWGSRTRQPLIVLHGWQDNAGSFDPLIPLLPTYLSYLVIDLPGHGLSSQIPDGMIYNIFDMIFVLNEISEKFQWQQISIMAHSMGAIISFLYASLLPDKINFVIAIDTLKPLVRSARMHATVLAYKVKYTIQADKYNRDKMMEPPCYTYPELIVRLVQGTSGSINPDVAPFLFKRGTKPSKNHPNKFYFSRDPRVKYITDNCFDQKLCLELAQRITATYLFIKSDDSQFSESRKNIKETIEVMKQNTKIQVNYVNGTHHVHMNHPKRISGIISDFLRRQWPEGSEQPIKSISKL